MIDDPSTEVTSRNADRHRAALVASANRVISTIKSYPLATWQWLIVAAIVVWLSLTAARLFWLLMPTPSITPAVVGVITEQSSGYGVSVDINRLKNLTPFGRAQEVKTPVAEAPKPLDAQMESQATDTTLNLVLRGVVASSDPKKGRALIAKGDRQANYSIGDVVPDGNNVTLERILPNRVILKNNGRFESLWLFKDDKSQRLGGPAQTPQPVRPQPAQAQQASPFTQRAEVGPQELSNPSIEELGATLTDIVSMSIHRENGQVVGYKIRPGRNVDMFNSFGLKADDIVTAVNGMPLNNPSQIMEIYQNISSATSANLEIRRGDSMVNVDINLQ